MDLDGMTVPSPSPRYSKTPAAVQGPPAKPGDGAREALADWGFAADEIDELTGAAVQVR